MKIEARGLSKTFGSKPAVDDLSFSLHPGQVTGFLGPNGSGKSTTLRLMLGLDQGAGSTLFDGKPLVQHEFPTKIVGAHLDAKLFNPQRRAASHLWMLASAANLPKSRVDEVITMLGLQTVAKDRPKTFSLGMSQRLGLAGALLGDPHALFLDEPANGLDPATIHWLRDFLRSYAAQGRTVFVSSHLLSEMELMADNVIVIAQGKLIAEGTASEFLNRSSRNHVYVRSTDDAKLREVLTAKGFAATHSESGLAVTGVDADSVGHICFEAGLPVLELVNRRANLEEVFLELTDDQQQYGVGGAA